MTSLNLNTTATSPAMNPFNPSFPTTSPVPAAVYPGAAPLVVPGGAPPTVPSFLPQVQGTTATGSKQPPPFSVAQMNTGAASTTPAGSSAVTVTATATPLMTDITAGAMPTPLIPTTSPSLPSDDISAAFQPTPPPSQPIATS